MTRRRHDIISSTRNRARASSGVALVLVVGGLLATSCSTEPAQAERGRATTTTTAETTPPPTTPPPTTVAIDPAVEAFVSECSNHVGFKLQTADAAYTAVWGHLDAVGIETECRRIATTDPDHGRCDAGRDRATP